MGILPVTEVGGKTVVLQVVPRNAEAPNATKVVGKKADGRDFGIIADGEAAFSGPFLPVMNAQDGGRGARTGQGALKMGEVLGEPVVIVVDEADLVLSYG